MDYGDDDDDNSNQQQIPLGHIKYYEFGWVCLCLKIGAFAFVFFLLYAKSNFLIIKWF